MLLRLNNKVKSSTWEAEEHKLREPELHKKALLKEESKQTE